MLRKLGYFLLAVFFVLLAAFLAGELLGPRPGRFSLTCASGGCLMLDTQTGQLWSSEGTSFVPVYVERVPKRDLYD